MHPMFILYLNACRLKLDHCELKSMCQPMMHFALLFMFVCLLSEPVARRMPGNVHVVFLKIHLAQVNSLAIGLLPFGKEALFNNKFLKFL